jgi:hypothetical protein
MEDFINGLLGMILGFTLGIILNTFIYEVIATILPLASLLYSIINIIIVVIDSIHEIPKLSAGYLMGWLTGSFLLFQAGLLDIFDITLNIIFPLFFLISKIIKSIFD